MRAMNEKEQAEQILKRVPRKIRSFVQKRADGFSYREAAQELAIGESRLCQLLREARENLQRDGYR
jgi:DNA-directed RNA polymerase specialized sigma24 family protein